MSYITYLKLTGSRQGLISAKCSTSESIGNRFQTGHEDEIQVLTLNHNISRSQNLSHHPVQFIKPIDMSSPLLGVSISSNEQLEAVFTCYRTNQNGLLELYYKLKLTKASIVDISSTYTNVTNSNGIIPHEKILLNYESISWEHITAGTSGYSIMENNIF